MAVFFFCGIFISYKLSVNLVHFLIGLLHPPPFSNIVCINISAFCHVGCKHFLAVCHLSLDFAYGIFHDAKSFFFYVVKYISFLKVAFEICS